MVICSGNNEEKKCSLRKIKQEIDGERALDTNYCFSNGCVYNNTKCDIVRQTEPHRER